MRRVAALTAVLSMTLPTAQIFAQNVKPSLDWSRISTLQPGTVIAREGPGSTFTRLDVLSANDNELTGLDLSDSSIPAPVVKQLRKAARVHPDYLLRPLPPGAIWVMDDELYLTSSSEIFLDRQKVADLRQIVRTVSRADVERGAVTLTIVSVPSRVSTGAKVCIGVSIAFVAFAIIIRRLVPYT